MSMAQNNEIILNDILAKLEKSITLLKKIQPSKELSAEMIQKWKMQLIARQIIVEKEKFSQYQP
jgi:hypothetical protein